MTPPVQQQQLMQSQQPQQTQQTQQQQFDYFFAPPPPPPQGNNQREGFALPGLTKTNQSTSNPELLRDEPGNRLSSNLGGSDNFNFEKRSNNFQNDYQQEYDDSAYAEPLEEVPMAYDVVTTEYDTVPEYDESLTNGNDAPPPPPPPPF